MIPRSQSRIGTLCLLLPAIALVVIGFVLPVGLVLVKSVQNDEISTYLPHFARAIQAWGGNDLPSADVERALARDLLDAKEARVLGRVARRLNFEQPGFFTLLNATVNALEKEANTMPPQGLGSLDKRWTDPTYWQILKRNVPSLTDFYFLTSLDLRRDKQGTIAQVSQETRVYVDVMLRTIWIATMVTIVCLIVAYPAACGLIQLSPRTTAIVLFFILMPFWTSVLVRSIAWVVLLQTNGVINNFLQMIKLTASPLPLLFNRFSTVVAMCYVLLPYMILILYSVMKRLDGQYVRAALSLGATPVKAFLKIYLPLTLPGIGAGSLIVFIIAAGFYVTPALVGGRQDQMISYFIAYNTNESVNWGLAAALSTILLLTVLTLFTAFNKYVEFDKVRIG